MKNNKNALLLLTPSWITNVVGVALGVLVTAGVIVLSRYQGSELRQQIFDVKANTPTNSSAASYQSVADNIANNNFLAAAPLLIVWACVGLVVYFFAMSIARSFGEAFQLHDQLEYVHSSRSDLIKEALLHLVIRALAVLGWFLFIKLSLSILVPYALAAANIASQSLSLSNIGYALLAVIVLYVDICIHAVFLRLIVLKPRLFNF
ncbi:hypothetical protein BH09PAT3_BH09PAT3_0500 [soil metagenome]